MSLKADDLRAAARTLDGCDIPTWHGPAATAYRKLLELDIESVRGAAFDLDGLVDDLNAHATAVEHSLVEQLVEHPAIATTALKLAVGWPL